MLQMTTDSYLLLIWIHKSILSGCVETTKSSKDPGMIIEKVSDNRLFILAASGPNIHANIGIYFVLGK